MGCNQSVELRSRSVSSSTSTDVDPIEIDLEFQTLWDKPRAERDVWKRRLEEISSTSFPLTERPAQLYSAVLEGKILNLSELVQLGVKRPTIRLFLSSTFTDTEIERNVLIEDVHPFLRLVGQKLGVQVHQSSEMRWGIRSEASSSHQTSEICMKEIDRCKDDSSGVAYVLILGNKFGFRPFPTKIPETEFVTLQGYIEQLNESFVVETNKRLKKSRGSRLSMGLSVEQQEQVASAESDLENNIYSKALTYLKEWYVLDENFIPPTRVLQPVPSDMSNIWWNEVFPALQTVLRKASAILEDKNRQLLYSQSVTSEEISHGMLEVSSETRERSCFVFDRTFDGIDVLHKDARFFMDVMNKTEVDEDAQTRLEAIRNETIPSSVSSDNIKHYQLNWGTGFSLGNEDHSNYIRKFADDFCTVILNSITTVAKENNFEKDELIEEVTAQAKFGNDRRSMFVSNASTRQTSDAALEYVQNKFASNEDDNVFAVCGVSGSGKTSLMAYISGELSDKYSTSDEGIVVTRFLGTSRDSANSRSVMLSILAQLSQAIEGKQDEKLKSLNYEQLQVKFKKLLASFGTKKKIVIVLDSLDQLTDQYNGRKLGWLPLVSVPKNVAIIVSSLPNVGGCWRVLEGVLSEETHCVHVQQISEEDAGEILSRWLESQGRRITPSQFNAVMGAYKNTPTPLYLMMCAEFFALRWSHTEEVDSSFFPADVKDLMDLVLENIETVHGKEVVRAALTYLTASQRGLSDTEMDDLLSLNDDVLQDVFEWWVPPVRRIPPLIFTRIVSDLRNTLVQRGAEGGITVNAWFHRQHWETATRRYLSDLDDVVLAHSDLANYFAGAFEEGKAITYRTTKDMEAPDRGILDRKITPMPLSLHGKVLCGIDEPEVNARKLSVLPYHLTKARMWQDCARLLTDLVFIQAKVMAKMVPDLLQDFNFLLETCPEDVVKEFELKRWSKFVSSNSHDFVRNPWSVIPRATTTPEWAAVCQAARKIELEYANLIPSTHTFAKPNRDSSRYALLKRLGGNVTSLTFTRDGKYACGGTEKGVICVFDVVRAELVFRLVAPVAVGNRFPPAVRGLVHLPSGELLSICKTTFTFWDLTTGEVVRESTPLSSSEAYACGVVLSQDGSRLIVGCSDSEKNYSLSCLDANADVEMFHLTDIPSLKCLAMKGNSKLVCCGFDGDLAWYNVDVGTGTITKDKVHNVDGKSMNGVVFETEVDEDPASFDVIVCSSKSLSAISYDTLSVTKSGVLGSISYSLAKVFNGKFLTVGNFDEQLEVYDISTFKQVMVMKGTMTGTIAVSPDTSLVASGGTNFSDVSVFDASSIPDIISREPDPEGLRYYFPPQLVTYNKKQAIVVGGPSPKVEIMDAATFEVLKTYDLGDTNTPTMISASVDGRYVVTSIRKGCSTVVIDLETDRITKDIFSHGDNAPKRAFFSPNCDRFVAANEYGSFCLVKLPGCRVIASSEGNRKRKDGTEETVFHTAEVVNVVFHPQYEENGLMLTGGCDECGKLWDARSGKLLRTLKGDHECDVYGVAFCGETMLATVDDNEEPFSVMHMWSLEDESVCIKREVNVDYPNHNVTNEVHLYWNTHLKLLVSVARNQKTKLWNLSGELVKCIDTCFPSLVPFHTVPRFALTVTFGGAKIMDVETWTSVLDVVGHDTAQGGSRFSLSHNDNFVASYGSDKKIMVHNIGEILRGRQGMLAHIVKAHQ
eukprot:m.224851 g.224851  ORF g.224851 m.224851 type:complete len:1709 (-) comp13855_c2_seq6:592-5718(-)